MQNLMRLHCRAPISPALFEEEAMGRSRGRGRQVANLHHARGCPCHTAHPAQLLPPAHTQMHPFVPKLKAMEVMSFLSSSCLGSDSDHIEEKQFPGFFCPAHCMRSSNGLTYLPLGQNAETNRDRSRQKIHHSFYTTQKFHYLFL